MKIIVTADVEVHTKNGDVSTSEIRSVFSSDDSVERILNWINRETDKIIQWVNDSLGTLDVVEDGYVRGTYAIKKNVTIKPVEE